MPDLAPVAYCDGTLKIDTDDCALPVGLVVAGKFVGVVPSYDNCPAVVIPPDLTNPTIPPSTKNGLAVVDRTGTLHSVATGGLLETIAGPHQLFVWANGGIVYTDIGSLAFWDREHGTVPLSSASQSWFFATDDGHVAFYTDADPNSSIMTLAAAKLDCSAANGVVKLESNVGLSAGMTGGRVVVNSFGQGGTMAVLRSYEPNTGVPTTLQTPTLAYASVPPISSIGTVLLRDPTSQAPSVIPAAGGASVSVGAGLPFDGDGRFTHDGRALVYVSGRAIVRAPADGGPTTKLASAALGLDALSNDDQWVSFHTKTNGGLGRHTYDAWLVSTTSGQPAAALNTAVTVDGGSLAFTNDSRWVYWTESGVLHAQPVTGGAERTFGIALSVAAAIGDRLVWDDDTQSNVPTVFAVDLAVGGSTTQTIAALPMGAKQYPARKWALTSDMKAIFYVASDGIYTAAIP